MSNLWVYRPFRTKLIQVNIPNILTVFRMLLIPVLVVVYCFDNDWKYLASGAIFTLACFTDWLDGYLARRLSQTSKFGAFLDPVADKLIVTITILLLVNAPHLPNILIPAIVIVGREITISSLREWMSEIGKSNSMVVNQMGKLKTLIQMLALGTLLAVGPHTPMYIIWLGYILLYMAAIFTIFSMFMYLRMAWREISTITDY